MMKGTRERPSLSSWRIPSLPGREVKRETGARPLESAAIPVPDEEAGEVPINALLQRGKRSIVLDVKRAEDHQTAQRLIERADVVIEGFRPGVMDRLGLGQIGL